MNEIDRQRQYYRETAAHYDQSHVSGEEPEHDFALHLLLGMAKFHGFQSLLDVGSGTGRGVAFISENLPSVRVLGIEPVEQLREVGHQKGISRDQLIAGDATALPFESESFDCAFSLGVMHHIPKPRLAIQEMLRVSRKGIFISDLNNFGCGSFVQRRVSHTLRFLGLWAAFQFVKNGFKPWKYTEGDGVHYSYSLLDDVSFLQKCGCDVYVFSTRPSAGNLLWSASHVAILALKKSAQSLT